MQSKESELIVKPDIISEELAKENITDKVIAELKEYMSLTISGIDDKEGYQQVDEARKICKKTRVIASKICKVGREEAIRVQKEWIGKEKEVTGQIQEVEDYLAELQKTIDDEKEAIKQRKAQEAAAKVQARASKLMAYGMVFNGQEYTLGELKISAVELKLFDDFTFTNFESKVEAVYNLQKEQEEIERKRREEEAIRLEKIAEEQRIEKERIEEEKRKLEEEKAALEAKRKEAEEYKIKARASSLFGLGMNFRGDRYAFHEFVILNSVLTEADDVAWEKVVDNAVKVIKVIKEKIEQERQREIEEAAKLKAEQELEAKRLKEEEERKQKEAEEALRPDKEKMLKLAEQIEAIQVPEFSTEVYKKHAVEIKEQFVKFGVYLRKKAK